MDARVAHHRRDVVVDENGRATVKVTLTDVEFDKELVLATVAPPFNGVDFDDYASVSHGDEPGREAKTTGRTFRVEEDTTRRGVAVAAIRTDRLTKIPKLTWSFKVTNAYPFIGRDLVVPRSSFYQEGADDHAGRGCVLRVHSGQLTLSLRFESADSVFAADTTRGLAEVQESRWHGIGHRWVPADDAQSSIHVDEKNVFTVTFDAPVVGRRYSIACFPDESVRRPAAPAEWTEAMFLISDLLRTRNDMDEGAQRLRTRLQTSLQDELERLYEAPRQDSNCTIAAFLWNPEERILQPVYGHFPVDHWGGDFKYGEGVAGHAFRFDKVATYHRTRNDTLIYRRRSLGDYEWVVCIPLRYADIIIGVVSFAGKRKLDDRISGELGALAAALPPFDAQQLNAFRFLAWRVNIAFLDVLANDDAIPSALRKRILVQQEKLVDQTMGAQPKPAPSSPDANRESAARSLVPVTGGGPPSHPAEPRPKPKKRPRATIVTAVIAALASVAGAAIAAWALVASKHDPAPASSSAPPAPPAEGAPSTKALPDRAHLLGLMESQAGLGELSMLDDTARQVSLDHANLSNHMLHGGCLQQFRFDEGDFTHADLSSARLDSTKLRSAHMDQCKAENADFRNAEMIGVSMRRAVLDGADLRSAKLIKADLSEATLRGAQLGAADLTGAVLTGTDLTSVDLRDVQGLTQKQLRAACTDGETLTQGGLTVQRRCRSRR